MNRGDVKLIIDRCVAHDVSDAADLIERLAAQIEMLRDALWNQLNDCINFNGGRLTTCIMEASTKALVTTPNQALEQFAANVREQCAQVCEDTEPVFDGYGYQCAKAIRDIKELPK